MKKAVFAIQVFGLIVAFPLYFLVELNHGTKLMPVNNSGPFAVEQPMKKEIRSVMNSTIKNENKVFVIDLKNSLK
jgi:hypothetical protein